MRLPRQFSSWLFWLTCFIPCLVPLRTLAQTTAPEVAAPSAATTAAPAAGSASPQAAPLPKEWSDAIGSLAKKIKAALGDSRALTLEFQNISSLSDTDAAAIESAFRTALLGERLELRAAADETAVKVRVTLSENTTDRIWVAEIEDVPAREVAMVSIAKTADRVPRSPVWISLAKTRVVSQVQPILDFRIETGTASRANPLRRLLILEPNGLIPPAIIDVQPMAPRGSRDLRGRIGAYEADGTRYFVGNIECISGSTIYCDENTSQSWPLSADPKLTAVYDPKHNYFFWGRTTNGPFGMPFYSAARFQVDQGPSLTITRPDGNAFVYGENMRELTRVSGWGDDIVSIQAECDPGPHVLVTGTGDWTKPDSLQLYEMDADHATPVGQPLQFSGPITALWPSDDGKSARVVSRDLATGEYEASIVTVVCNN